MEIKKLPLNKDQYYSTKHKKTHIFLHHTAGGSVASAMASWNSTKERVATAYIIERNGEVYEAFNPDYWAYSLGVTGATALEKATIGIELVAFGPLTRVAGKFFTWTNREIPKNEVAEFDPPYRGSRYYHDYTISQMSSLCQLLKMLNEKYKIPLDNLKEGSSKYVDYRDWKKLPSGVWSHTTVRKDKSDILPIHLRLYCKEALGAPFFF